jgi:hypothetical protein
VAALLLAGCASWSGNVATSPTSLNFGNVLVGSSRNQNLTITNHGADAFTLTQAVASAEGFIVKAPALPVAIPGGQNATLTISFAPTAIGGVAGSLLITRTQLATPGVGNASVAAPSVRTSEVVKVTVSGVGMQATPSIMTEPASQTIAAGQTATFSLVASGATPLSYQWKKNGSDLIGATSPSYTTPSETTADNRAQFAAVVSNPAGQVTTSSATLSVQPPPGTPLQITPVILANAQAGVPFQFGLSATGGVLPYEWSVGSGTLPSGLSIGAGSGIISGTPLKGGQFDFSVQVSDSSSPIRQTAMKALTLSILAFTLQINSVTLPNGQVGVPFPARVSGSGGVTPYTWTIAGALPRGLNLGATSGAISGTPTQAGASNFTIALKDSSEQSTQKLFSVTIAGAGIKPLAISTTSLPPSSVQEFYSQALQATGGTSPYAWTIAAGQLPGGIALNSSTGQLAGTPTSAGQYTFTVQVRDSGAPSQSAAMTFTVPATAPSTLGGETAKSADAFVNSVGVNTHLHYTNTPYGNFAAVKTALTNLGIRHIRDGLTDTTLTAYYDHLNELGKLGVKSTLVTSGTESGSVLAQYPLRVPDSFEAYEAPNEFDLSPNPNWAVTLNAFLTVLSRAVKSDPNASRFPIVGPSFTQPASFPKVAASGPFFDYANLHNYFGGRNPGTPGWGNNGYGSIDWNLSLVRDVWPDKPIITTETGYRNDLANVQGIPEAVSGKYLPRLLLEQWMHGIQRTFLYELVDLGGNVSDSSYGLVHSDFTPKPGYAAVQGLLQLLSDPGPASKLDTLNFKLSGDLTNVHHLLLEKRNGAFYLALWIEQPGYDVNTKTLLPVAAQQVTVQTGGPTASKVYQFDAAGHIQTLPVQTGLSRTMTVDDRVLILQIGGPFP